MKTKKVIKKRGRPKKEVVTKSLNDELVEVMKKHGVKTAVILFDKETTLESINQGYTHELLGMLQLHQDKLRQEAIDNRKKSSFSDFISNLKGGC